MSNKNFSELLKSALLKAGINASELANRIGVNLKQIRRYEESYRVPYDDRLLAICKALELDVNAATAAKAVSIQQYAGRGKINIATRSVAAAYARSCKKRQKPSIVKSHTGFCPCFGVKFSSIDSLLRACLVRQKNGENRCQNCKVLSSCGKNEEALKACSITIMGDKS